MTLQLLECEFNKIYLRLKTMSDPGNIRERAQAGEGERPKSLTAKVTNIVNFLNLDEEEMVKRSELHYERFDALRSQYFKGILRQKEALYLSKL